MKTKIRPTGLVTKCTLIVIGFLLVACSSAPTKIQYYTLHPVTNRVSNVVQEGSEVLVNGSEASNPMPELTTLADFGAVGIGPIILPGMLDRTEILTYSPGQQVLLQHYRYWAENLKTLVSRVVTENIQKFSGYENVWSHPWGARLRPQKNIELTITQMGGALGGDVHLNAKWRLLDDSGSTLVAMKNVRLQVSAQGNDYDSYTQAINYLVNELSLHITSSLHKYK